MSSSRTEPVPSAFEPSPVTWEILVVLDALDQDHATFAILDGPNGGTRLTVPREQWGNLGRPASLRVHMGDGSVR